MIMVMNNHEHHSQSPCLAWRAAIIRAAVDGGLGRLLLSQPMPPGPRGAAGRSPGRPGPYRCVFGAGCRAMQQPTGQAGPGPVQPGACGAAIPVATGGGRARPPVQGAGVGLGGAHLLAGTGSIAGQARAGQRVCLVGGYLDCWPVGRAGPLPRRDGFWGKWGAAVTSRPGPDGQRLVSSHPTAGPARPRGTPVRGRAGPAWHGPAPS